MAAFRGRTRRLRALARRIETEGTAWIDPADRIDAHEPVSGEFELRGCRSGRKEDDA
jgi:hypothetical protein